MQYQVGSFAIKQGSNPQSEISQSGHDLYALPASSHIEMQQSINTQNISIEKNRI